MLWWDIILEVVVMVVIVVVVVVVVVIDAVVVVVVVVVVIVVAVLVRVVECYRWMLSIDVILRFFRPRIVSSNLLPHQSRLFSLQQGMVLTSGNRE